ncbi:MAG: hypothetical protein J7598_16915 [Mitsuaria chitosanitabida]|uniref:hypothetical protein n=1 Tax=Roseateles chitosanitabidus TaxID=65048 RepID=UPI001B0E0A34|nr:hypothetical protein [Roseateles chitosanitabidus]MBO9688286.1 hypothetical protein [Roseateles chitosanitabidus]
MTHDTAPAVLNQSAWEDVFKGYEIVGVAIRDRDTLQTLARKAVTPEEGSHLLDGQIPTRIASIFLSDPEEDNVGYQELNGFAYPKLGVSRAPFERPGGLVTGMGKDGHAWPFGGGNGPMEMICPGDRPATLRLRCHFGRTYSVGLGRAIFRRDAVGQWTRIEGIPMSRDEDALQAAGFTDLDAFSETDLYAVGGHGDVWHFDGQAWRQMRFPSNEQLATVTCGGDGQVYITSEGGSLWVGERSTWRLLERRGSSILWNDTRWFNDQLWLASDYQLRVWNGREIAVPEHEGKPVLASGHMDAHDGLLVVADLWTVSTFDGREWRKVVAPYAD